DLAPLAPPRRVVLAAHRVVEAPGWRLQGRAGVAVREVPELRAAVRPDLGPAHRQHQQRRDGEDTARDPAVAVQLLPPPGRAGGDRRRDARAGRSEEWLSRSRCRSTPCSRTTSSRNWRSSSIPTPWTRSRPRSPTTWSAGASPTGAFRWW